MPLHLHEAVVEPHFIVLAIQQELQNELHFKLLFLSSFYLHFYECKGREGGREDGGGYGLYHHTKVGVVLSVENNLLSLH